jgi:hypothetical protein
MENRDTLWEGGGELKIMNAFEKQWATVNKFPCLTRLSLSVKKPEHQNSIRKRVNL